MTRVNVLWKSISDVFEATLRHPFLQELIEGRLPFEIFRHYIVQDALYLSSFSRSVATVATKADDDESVVILLTNARDVLLVERASLHEMFFSKWGMTMDDVNRTPMTPTNMAYTNYLSAVAYSRPFIEGLAAILPCFWVYLEVGKHLVSKGSPNLLYQKWIDTYSSKEYEEAVRKTVDITEKQLQNIGQNELKQVICHFRLSTIYEYLFWDSAYRLESWPFQP
ncbi:MAG: thiaminase II [Candidatus Caldarchaeum sp.]